MNVLLLGSGGREHALAWKLAQSPRLTSLHAIPGNPGIAQHAACHDVSLTDHAAVIDFCRTNEIGLVVVGPEAPLVDGLSNSLRDAGFAVFGPSQAAAQLEGSKGFTKDLCARVNIPTAGYVRVSDLETARAVLARDFGRPVVIKADGLAAGKGVTVAISEDEAQAAIAAIFEKPGGEAVIEEFLEGEEASFFVITDGTDFVTFGSAQDHKRVGDGDVGPNTGGMGAYSPAPVLTPQLEAEAIETIIKPTIRGMAEAGTPYSGVLYAGLMLTRTGPKLIEYNARFGDPECQVLMLRFEDDLLDLMLATEAGELAGRAAPRFKAETALTVVMAANGYPGTPQIGGAIQGIQAAEQDGAKVFQAGTKQANGEIVAAGGRVLAVTATGASVTQAQAAAYRAVDKVDFPTGFARRDIGWREVAREAGN